MQLRRLFIIPVALLLSMLAYLVSTLFIQVPVAQAHAYVIGSDPVDGSTISVIPNEVRIYFNASISILSSAHVYSIQNGNLVDVNAASSTISTSNPRELVTPLKTPRELPQGSYEVIWTAVANDDGHTTYGIIGFNVGFSSTGLSGTTILGPSTSNNLDDIHKLNFTNILAIFWEWLVLIALTFWIGQLVIEHLLLAKGRLSGLFPRAQKRTTSLQWSCLIILFCGEIVSLILRTTLLSNASTEHHFSVEEILNFIVQTNYGRWWLVRIALLLIALGILYWAGQPSKNDVKKAIEQAGPVSDEVLATAKRLSSANNGPKKTIQLIETPSEKPATPRTFSVAWLVLAGLIVFATVQSRSAAAVLEPHYSAMLFDFLYFIAQGTWLGGFTYLGSILLPILLGTELEYNTETLILLLKRFTPLLLISMGVQLICALFLGEASIDNGQQLITDPYGRTLTVQIIILALEIALTLYALCIVRPKIAHQALRLPVVHADLPTRRTRQFELKSTGRHLKLITGIIAVLGAGLLLCSAFLSFFAPPIHFPTVSYATPLAEASNANNTQTKEIGDLTVTLQILPGRSGEDNTAILTILDAHKKPVSDAEVRLTTNMQIMNMGTGHATIASGNPTYIVNFDKKTAFNMAGLWLINVEIQRPGQQAIKGTFQIILAA